jgi:pectate lyase
MWVRAQSITKPPRHRRFSGDIRDRRMRAPALILMRPAFVRRPIIFALACVLASACSTSSMEPEPGAGGAGGGVAGTGGGSGTAGTSGTMGAGGGAGTAAGGTGMGGRGGAAGSAAAGTGGTAGAATATGTAGTGGANCTTPPDPGALVGWAANGTGTTGGGTTPTPQRVSTLAELNAAAAGSSPAIIYVSGVLPNGTVTIGSNKTIVGLCGAEIHGHVEIVNSSNVIVRNIKVVGYGVGNCALDPAYDATIGCSSGADAITVERSNHLWFDHDDISDGTDGNLDITLGSDFVTVSWTKFHYTARTDAMGNDSTGAAGHRYSNLIGGSDNSTGDVGKLNVTWHHNWWADRVVERQPRIRYGKNHLFNNLWSSSGDNYCVRAGTNAQILLENNAFIGVKTPQEFNNTADMGTAYITATNNVYTGVSGGQATGGGGTPFTTPGYTYMLDAGSNVQSLVQAGAGPR